MVKVTKTINQLHFDALDPDRFEDLIRQLLYDFKNWISLEDTGSSGNDEGFDARGWERNQIYDSEPLDDEGQTNESIETKLRDRLWLIQCKRTRVINPKKMKGYLEEIFSTNKEELHGIIFAASCDFSKETRDVFRSFVRKNGVQEYQLWGKGELEDMLFQPKNDNLLFAYFGISLLIRKRSQITRIKSILTIKRKISKTLGEPGRNSFKPIFIRNINDRHYPDKKYLKPHDLFPMWFPADFLGHYVSGIRVIFRRHMAAIHNNSKNWDYIKTVNEVQLPGDYREISKYDRKKREDAEAAWNKTPEERKAHLEIVGYIPYERIVAIDEGGDDLIQNPHLYVDYLTDNTPFDGMRGILGKAYHSTQAILDPANPDDIVKIFPIKLTAFKTSKTKTK